MKGDTSPIVRPARSKQTIVANENKIKELKKLQKALEKNIDWENPSLDSLRELSLLNYKIEVAEARSIIHISTRTLISTKERQI